MSKQDREAYYATFADSPDEQIAVRNRVKFPTHKPYFNAILVDHEGYVLVETSAAPSAQDGAMYDVFDGAGKFVGPVEISHGDAKGLFGGLFYGLRGPADETLPTVVRYRLRE